MARTHRDRLARGGSVALDPFFTDAVVQEVQENQIVHFGPYAFELHNAQLRRGRRVLPYPILRRLSSTSDSRATPRSARIRISKVLFKLDITRMLRLFAVERTTPLKV